MGGLKKCWFAATRLSEKKQGLSVEIQERERQRQREIERDRERQREIERERDRQTDRQTELNIPKITNGKILIIKRRKIYQNTKMKNLNNTSKDMGQ